MESRETGEISPAQEYHIRSVVAERTQFVLTADQFFLVAARRSL